MTRYNPNYTHTITYVCGGKTGVICDKSSDTTVTWDANTGNTVALASENTTGKTLRVVFNILTHNGNTTLELYQTEAYMTIPSSVKPTLTLAVSDDAGYFSTYGAYVQGWSRPKITVSPTLAYGSPIKSYAITVEGKTYTSNPAVADVVQGKGTLDITAVITDSREYPSDPVTKPITVLEYYKPSVNAIAYRCNSSGAEDQEGAYMRVGFTSAIADLNGKNAASYEITYSGGAGAGKLTGTGTTFTSSPIACDPSAVWSIEVKITDKFDSTTKAAVIPIAFTLMDFYFTGKGIAFGKVATRDGFDCAMDAYFTGNVTLSNGFVDGSDTGWVRLNDVIYYRRKNGYVTVIGGSYAHLQLSAGVYTQVGMLPTGYCPIMQTPIVFHTVGGAPVAQSGFINPNGEITLYSDSTTVAYWAFVVTYPL